MSEKVSELSVMDKMVKDNNQGIAMSTTIVSADFVPQGVVVGFGLANRLGEDAKLQTLGLPGEYMFMCFAVKRTEFDQTKIKLESDLNNTIETEKKEVQICYKTNEPCKFECEGLCKESC